MECPEHAFIGLDNCVWCCVVDLQKRIGKLEEEMRILAMKTLTTEERTKP